MSSITLPWTAASGEMRLAGQVELAPGNGKGTPYAVTDWMRRSVGPLVAALRWECENLAQEAGSLAPLDVETVFLLAVPLLKPTDQPPGSGKMAAEFPIEGDSPPTSVLIDTQSAAVEPYAGAATAGCRSRASGSPAAWLQAVIDDEPAALEIAGDRRLAGGVLKGLQEVLAPG
jgi:hypothetical protein